jgi:hypothetical protein
MITNYTVCTRKIKSKIAMAKAAFSKKNRKEKNRKKKKKKKKKNLSPANWIKIQERT